MSSVEPYTISIVEGLVQSLLRGFRLNHPYNKEAGISYSSFSSLLKYHPDGYRFMPKYIEGKWDGYIYLSSYSKRHNSTVFPCGLTRRVVSYFKDHGVRVKQQFTFDKPDPKLIKIPTRLLSYKFRKYQRIAIKHLLYKRRGILKCPTGSGKTAIGCGFVKCTKGQVVWLTDQKDLLYQTKEAFENNLGIKVGILGDGKRDISHRVTIASVKTVYLHFEELRPWLNKTSILFGDEIHKATSREWFECMKRIPAIYRIGLSATPLQGEKFLLLEAATGPILYDVPAKKLIEQSYLSQPHIFMINAPKRKIPEYEEYSEVARRGITQSKKRNDLIVKVAKELAMLPETKPVVITMKHRKHVALIVKRLKKTSFAYKSATGTDSGKYRQRVYKSVEDGITDILAISGIFDTGIDVKNIRALIVAAGGKTYHKVIQRLGRGMRTTDIKFNVIVVDFYDASHDYLRKQSNKRRRMYMDEGYKVMRVTFDQFQTEIRKLVKKWRKANV